jgi:XXXCH domain-containing protein
MSMSKDQAAHFLRTVADCIENGKPVIEGYDIDLSDFQKLKMSLKKISDLMNVKLKLKLVSPEDTQEDDEFEEEKYSKLKKRMEVYFKDLLKSLQDNQIPSREIVSVFLRDSEQMTGYPGYGDEYYQEYRRACQDFEKVYEREDLAGLKECADTLNTLKSRCHDKYK